MTEKELLIYMYDRYINTSNSSMVLPHDCKYEVEALARKEYVKIHPAMPMGMMVSLTEKGINGAKNL